MQVLFTFSESGTNSAYAAQLHIIVNKYVIRAARESCVEHAAIYGVDCIRGGCLYHCALGRIEEVKKL
jgi:hypothetical protein